MPQPTVPPDHAAHDPLLVAAFAAGDATGPRLVEAAALVARCHDCAALHHDLRAIAMALPATAATPPSARPRDFRLTPDQAATLRPSGWRRLLAPFAGPSFAFARPLGTGLATLGLAGILVAGASGIPLGGAASAPAEDAAAGAPMAAGEASPGTEELYLYNAAATEVPVAGGGGPGSMPEPSPAGAGDERTDGGGGGVAGPSAGPEEQPPSTDEMLTAVGAPLATASEPAATKAEPLAGDTQVPSRILAGGAGLVALAAGFLLLVLRFAARRIA